MKKLALLFLFIAVNIHAAPTGFAWRRISIYPMPQTHTFPALDTNNAFTGTNTWAAASTFNGAATFNAAATFNGTTTFNSTIASMTITTANLTTANITTAHITNPLTLTATANNATPFHLAPFTSSQSAPLLDVNTGVGSSSCVIASLVCFHSGITSGVTSYFGFIVADTGDNIFQFKNANSSTGADVKMTNGGQMQFLMVGATTSEYDFTPGLFKYIDPTSGAKIVVGPSGTTFQVDVNNGAVHPGDNTLTVAALPAVAGAAGKMVVVGDSTAVAAEGQVCVGGNTHVALAFSDGSNWKCF